MTCNVEQWHACMHMGADLKVRRRASFWLEERPRSTAMLSTKPAKGMEASCSKRDPSRVAASALVCGTLHNTP